MTPFVSDWIPKYKVKIMTRFFVLVYVLDKQV